MKTRLFGVLSVIFFITGCSTNSVSTAPAITGEWKTSPTGNEVFVGTQRNEVSENPFQVGFHKNGGISHASHQGLGEGAQNKANMTQLGDAALRGAAQGYFIGDGYKGAAREARRATRYAVDGAIEMNQANNEAALEAQERQIDADRENPQGTSPTNVINVTSLSNAHLHNENQSNTTVTTGGNGRVSYGKKKEGDKK